MTAAAAPDEAVPFRGYDGLEGRGLVAQLRLRSQVELAQIERYERSHKDRRAVLDKLRYLRNREPLECYDLLDRDEILARLSAADMTTLGRVRGYEMKLRGRTDVLAGLARIRAERGTGPSMDAGIRAHADAGRSVQGGAASGGTATAGIIGVIGIAAVLMLVLVVILAFLIVAAVAPGLLIQ